MQASLKRCKTYDTLFRESAFKKLCGGFLFKSAYNE